MEAYLFINYRSGCMGLALFSTHHCQLHSELLVAYVTRTLPGK